MLCLSQFTNITQLWWISVDFQELFSLVSRHCFLPKAIYRSSIFLCLAFFVQRPSPFVRQIKVTIVFSNCITPFVPDHSNYLLAIGLWPTIPLCCDSFQRRIKSKLISTDHLSLRLSSLSSNMRFACCFSIPTLFCFLSFDSASRFFNFFFFLLVICELEKDTNPETIKCKWMHCFVNLFQF